MRYIFYLLGSLYLIERIQFVDYLSTAILIVIALVIDFVTVKIKAGDS